MAHKSPDFDAIGASVGIARLAQMCKRRVNIVTDFKDYNVKRCFKHLERYENLKGVFVESSKGLNLVRTDTLLIIVDVNNVAMFESRDLARMVDDIIYIDHHRKTAEFEKKPVLDYIEPSASSTSEIVAEILEQAVPMDFLTPMDADMLYAGIVLDTKNFTKGAGTKTYSAAMYLRDRGAQYERIQNLFKTKITDYKKEIKFAERLDIYRNCFAIAINESGKDSQDRIMAAKIADNMLTLDGVVASFALVKIGNTVAISARSNGSVNVQLILEELNGGGRYDAAGAQVGLNDKEPTIQHVLARLKQAIDAKISIDD
jgi:c-di-AMP phosphodiesterase-like protein